MSSWKPVTKEMNRKKEGLWSIEYKKYRTVASATCFHHIRLHETVNKGFVQENGSHDCFQAWPAIQSNYRLAKVTLELLFALFSYHDAFMDHDLPLNVPLPRNQWAIIYHALMQCGKNGHSIINSTSKHFSNFKVTFTLLLLIKFACFPTLSFAVIGIKVMTITGRPNLFL